MYLTGSTGFIGFNAAKFLAAKNFKIFTAARTGPKSQDRTADLSNRGLSIFSGNFYDHSVLDSVFKNKIDYVVHIAALRGETDESQEVYQKINVQATRTLLEYALKHKVKRFIYCSSVGVYGTNPKFSPASTETQYFGDSNYHNSKIDAEKLVEEYRQKGLDTLILQPTITYGSGDDGFLPRLIELVKNRRFPNPAGDIKIHLLSIKVFEQVLEQTLTKQLPRNKYIIADRNFVELNTVVNLIYMHFYHRLYPKWIKIPTVIFRAGEFLLLKLKKKKTAISLKLISRDWFYDVSETANDFPVELRDTKREIKKYLETEYNHEFTARS